MKIGLMVLPFVCVAGVAMADSMEKEGTADQMATAAAADKAPAHYRMAKRGPKRLPGGDIRHCLDLQTSVEIIRCSETRRKK